MKKYLQIVIAAGLCVSAATLPATEPAEPAGKSVRTAEFLFDPFDPPIDRSIADENAIEKLLTRFGEPKSRTQEEGRDPRDPTVTTEYLIWVYDGLTVHLQGTVGTSGRWITQMILDGGDYRLKFGLGLNVDRCAFLSLLDPALLNNKDHQTRFQSAYSNSTMFEGEEYVIETNTLLDVDFDLNGKSTRLTWKYYAD